METILSYDIISVDINKWVIWIKMKCYSIWDSKRMPYKTNS